MKFLVIQTAFLGDAILATSVVESLRSKFPGAHIDFLVKKGNETVFSNNPYIREVLVFDKKKNKLFNLLTLGKKIRTSRYDHVINIGRFGSSGFLAWRSGAKEITGFSKNPFSFCYTRKVRHEIGTGKHEVERNHELIQHLVGDQPANPKLYPSPEDVTKAGSINAMGGPYVCIAPASVWFTKQFPREKWIELINALDKTMSVYLLGASPDHALCAEIEKNSAGRARNLAGTLSITQTAALMRNAAMNYVNDSAPMHIASAMNAPVTAIYCSTQPAFGFGPLSGNSKIIEVKEKLECRPCGLHGYASCPKGHFKCALNIEIKDILHA